jgi:hypothetical protein
VVDAKSEQKRDHSAGYYVLFIVLAALVFTALTVGAVLGTGSGTDLMICAVLAGLGVTVAFICTNE